MIDFRYHLVSVVAVFLALAVGIVVGTTALNGGIVDTLKSSNKQVIRDKRALEQTVEDLRTQVVRRDDVAEAVAALAVAGRLANQRVVVLTAPGVSTDAADGVQELVRRAGGAAGGVVRLRDDLLDPAKGQVLDDLVADLAPADLDLPEGTPTDRAALVLAAALVRSGGGGQLPADAVTKVIGGMTSAGFIDVQGGAGTERATLAVLLVPPGPGEPLDAAGEQRERSLLVLARSFDSRSEGVVVAGPTGAAEQGGVVRAVRDDDGLSDSVSTVDGSDTATGELVIVLALAEQATGAAGSYGQGPGARAGAPAATTR